MSPVDRLISLADEALRTLSGSHHAARPYPTTVRPSPPLGPQQKRLAGALMRVDHVGEICAQALYSAQALATESPALERQFRKAAREETDHLAWTAQRLRELGARPSLLNPIWYAGAFGIGLVAARAGDAVSLGFVVETERQVEQHLESHLERLPQDDVVSRALVEQMREDEARHGSAARDAGAATLPFPVRWAMRLAARVMTATAHRI